MSNTPAGWYPQSDGQQRYWDGERWTEHFAPGAQQEASTVGPEASAVSVESHGQPGASDSARGAGPIGFVKRHKVLSGIVGGLLLLGVIGALSGGGDDRTTIAAVVETQGPSESSTASSTPSSSPSASPSETPAEVTPTPTPTETEEAEPVPASEPEGTAAQMNALRSAEDYLSFKGFSKAGLIDQLSSEYGDGYKKADAKWAVEQLDVNWNEEAVRVAESYLEMKGFSRNGLIDQLSSEYGEQFTVKQATYAAKKVGL
ncbi:MAG: Ltp family lipoprotein [Ornithinibacter sp.]